MTDPIKQAKAKLQSAMDKHLEYMERGEFDDNALYQAALTKASEQFRVSKENTLIVAAAKHAFKRHLMRNRKKCEADMALEIIHCPSKYTAHVGELRPHLAFEPEERIFYKPEWYMNTDDITAIPIEKDLVQVTIHEKIQESNSDNKTSEVSTETKREGLDLRVVLDPQDT